MVLRDTYADKEMTGVVKMTPVDIAGHTAIGVEVELPKTHLVAISVGKGYIMCGALDVQLLNTRLAERHIVAGRALGVRTIDDLLEKPLTDITDAAGELGITVGMTGREALQRMI